MDESFSSTEPPAASGTAAIDNVHQAADEYRQQQLQADLADAQRRRAELEVCN
jgi:hypothetical protein